MSRGDRKDFFEEVVKYTEYDNCIFRRNGNTYLSIYEDDNLKCGIGISKSGDWLFWDTDKFYLLNESKNYLYCLKLVEIPYASVKNSIENRYKKIMRLISLDISKVFPAYYIVEFIFVNAKSDYWFGLAWEWYGNLSTEEKNMLENKLNAILKETWLSQKSRYRVRKEVSYNKKR